MVKKYTKYYF